MTNEISAPRRWRRPLAWTLAAAVLAAGGAWWWHQHTAAAADSPAAAGGRRFAGANRVQPVSVGVVRRQDLTVSVSAIGTMTASNTAVVRTQVSGVLQKLHFSEGQQLRAGQLLAELDLRSFQAALSQAEGALARDQAQLAAARVDLARYRDLLARDAIARQQLDSQAALVAQLEGTVAADQGAVANARVQLSYTRVTAPIPGRAGLKQLDLGNTASPSDTNGLVSITQTRPIAMVFAVPAANVARIAARLRAGDTVTVEAWDRASKTRLAAGRVAALDNAIDPATDTIKVKALFPNTDDTLFPNQSVSVTLQLDTLKDQLAVPQAAVLRGAQGFYVYRVDDDGTVAPRAVKPGASDRGWVAVDGELKPGERVVIDGTDRLRDGAKVEVVDAAQRAASAPAGRPDPLGRLDRLPPELAAKLKAMSPDERRAWFREHRGAASAPAASQPAR